MYLRILPIARLACAVLLLVAGTSGCGGLPQVARTASHALADNSGTRLGQVVQTRLGERRGLSGAWPLEDGVDAFGARLGLARVASRTLDVQYYIFHPDPAGHVVLGELLAAADRGVRVRLLLDDIHTAKLEPILAAAACHPNIQVRLFNPFVHRRARWLDAVFDFRRVSRRMHNKSLTADNAATIVGGRNIGAEYFGVREDLDFSDLDLLIVGPVVTQVSAQFDQYWNSLQAYPLGALVKSPRDAGGSLRALRGDIARQAAALRSAPASVDPGQNGMARALAEGRLPKFYWGSGTVIADPPIKVVQPPHDSERHAAIQLLGLLREARRELILVSPYFVPGKRGVEWLQGLVRRGVQVQVITNSFAATDVRAVHAGYARYRKDLLRAGVVLYEMKPTAHTALARQIRRQSLTGSSRSSLHAKAYMTDRRVVYVGSFNLDRRSARLNTEMGVVVDNDALYARLDGDFLRRILDVAYRVELVGDAGDARLAWITREGEREVRYDSEPDVGVLQKLYLGVLQILPIEDQL
jgi:putative cardiolipin synthase